jgi:LysM repeat protein
VSGFSPARLLAPIALVLTALALIIVVSSGGDDSSSGGSGAEPTATATAASNREERRERREQAQDDEADTKTYTVKSGDSPSSIAEAEGISVDELLEANPDADPNALGVGDELEIPAG